MWIRRPTASHCAALGEALAQLHLAGADFPMRRRNALSADGWRPLYVASAAGADTVQPGLREAIEKELTLLEGAWPSGLPEGVIHADLFPDNVFFLGEKLSGLIDFYFACTDTLTYDIAICLNAWCFEPDHSYNVTKGRALLQGYVGRGRSRSRNASRCRCSRAAPRCASCSRAWSTGSTCRPARWCGRRTRSSISASCASTRR
jgi:homoserine kinase type II